MSNNKVKRKGRSGQKKFHGSETQRRASLRSDSVSRTSLGLLGLRPSAGISTSGGHTHLRPAPRPTDSHGHKGFRSTSATRKSSSNDRETKLKRIYKKSSTKDRELVEKEMTAQKNLKKKIVGNVNDPEQKITVKHSYFLRGFKRWRSSTAGRIQKTKIDRVLSAHEKDKY